MKEGRLRRPAAVLVVLGAFALFAAPAAAAPTAPGQPHASAKGTSWIRFAWQDRSGSETRYDVRVGPAAGPLQTVNLGRNATVLTRTTLSPATSYRIRVRACNATDCSPFSGANVRTFTDTLGGCGVFPAYGGLPFDESSANQDAWNQDISQAPVATNSNSIINYINNHGADHLHPDFGRPIEYGIPFISVGAGQPKVPIHFTAYGDESDPGPAPIPNKAPVEGGPGSDGDRHVLVLDRGTCKLYELYNAFKRKRAGWNADSMAVFDLNSLQGRPGGFARVDGFTSADAAGLPIMPGLPRLGDGASIDHALRITFDNTRSAYIHPATHCASDLTAASIPAMGQRLRLKASYLESHSFSGEALVVARAMAKYGVINADNGSNWFISGEQDTRWADGNLNQLKSIPGSAFEVVRNAAPVHTC
jgi:hypothetical protein